MIKSRNVQPQLGVHFSSENNGIWRAQLIVQDTAKAKSLAWKAFGKRPIDGWLYGNIQLNLGMDYSITVFFEKFHNCNHATHGSSWKFQLMGSKLY